MDIEIKNVKKLKDFYELEVFTCDRITCKGPFMAFIHMESKRIFVFPEFLKLLTPDEQEFILMHEYAHYTLGVEASEDDCDEFAIKKLKHINGWMIHQSLRIKTPAFKSYIKQMWDKKESH